MADAGEPVPAFKDRRVCDDAAGELRDGARRYVLLRPDALMAMFRLLPPDTRAPRRAGAGSAPARLGQRARLPGAQRRRRRNAADDHRAHFAAAWLGPLALRSRR